MCTKNVGCGNIFWLITHVNCASLCDYYRQRFQTNNVEVHHFVIFVI